jgi:tetratricopeptide (TPR) repeat protein
MPRLRLLVVLAFAALLFVPSAHAFQLENSAGIKDNFLISGNVYLRDTNHPAVNVMVRLRGVSGSDLADAATNESGAFVIYNLKPAVYALEIEVEGYQPASEQVDLTFSSTRSMQVILAPAASAEASQPAAVVSSHELSVTKKARDFLQSGKIKLYEQSDPAGAIEDFKQALAVEPGFYEAEYQIGLAYLAQGKRDEAAGSFQKSVDLSDQKYGPGFVGLGTLALDRKDYATSDKLLAQGISLSPDFWLAHYEMGRALLDENKPEDAEKSAEQARSLSPGSPLVYRLLANIHIQQKDYRAAEGDIDAYLKLDPDSAAGRRAKQLRDELAQKVDAQPSQPGGDASKLQH